MRVLVVSLMLATFAYKPVMRLVSVAACCRRGTQITMSVPAAPASTRGAMATASAAKWRFVRPMSNRGETSAVN